MRYFFWFFFSAEVLLVLWLLLDDLKRPDMPMTPATWLGILWLIAALVVRLVMGWTTLSNLMVGFPGVVLLVYGAFLLLVVKGGGRWN